MTKITFVSMFWEWLEREKGGFNQQILEKDLFYVCVVRM